MPPSDALVNKTPSPYLNKYDVVSYPLVLNFIVSLSIFAEIVFVEIVTPLPAL